MNSVQTLPRQYSQPNPYASQAYTRRDTGSSITGAGSRVPRVLKRLLKFPQMDFEVAIWEMTTLIIAPKKVFRNMYYHKQTKNTYTTADPAFPYLLAFFLTLASLAWSLAYATPSLSNILRIAAAFVFGHCLLLCLASATVHFLLVGRLFGPGGVLRGLADRLPIPGARGRSGGQRFGAQASGESDELEFGFCFDVALRAYLPVFLDLYILQFILLPLLASHATPAVLLANTLHVVAYSHALYINWLGYASLPFLSSTHLVLVPCLGGLAIFWLVASLSGWNASLHMAPVLWCTGVLRRTVGGP